MPWLVELNDLGGIDVWRSNYVPHSPGTVFHDEQAALLHALDSIEARMDALRSSRKSVRTGLRRIRRREYATAIRSRGDA